MQRRRPQAARVALAQLVAVGLETSEEHCAGMSRVGSGSGQWAGARAASSDVRGGGGVEMEGKGWDGTYRLRSRSARS